MSPKLLSAVLMVAFAGSMSVFAAGEAKPPREVVSFRKLKEAMPEKMGDLVQTSLTGQTTTVEDNSTSMATGSYAKDKDGAEPTVTLTVMDESTGAMAAAGAQWAKMKMNTETDDGYMKTTVIDGNPAMEQYNTKDKSGSFTIVVAARFYLTVQVQGMGEDEFKKVKEQLPLKKLAELAK